MKQSLGNVYGFLKLESVDCILITNFDALITIYS